MRDYIIFAIVFGSLPFTLKRPVIGILTFTWISLMNPHRLSYGAAYSFPFAAIIAGVTLVSLLFSKEPKRLPLTPLTTTLIIFIGWMTMTTFFALEPDKAWYEWNRVMKTMLMVFVAMLAINSKRDIKGLVWIIALSLGFYGFKGGLFTIASGGTYQVVGPGESYIGDNNALALALVTVAPIIWYLQMHTEKKWLRLSLRAAAFLTVISAVGSYSRGALLAGAAMLFVLWIKGKNKMRSGVALLLIVPVIYMVMPEKWFGRMETIHNYQADASAMGRINAWHFAVNVAQNNFIGGGYSVFTPRMFMVYAPEPLNYHVAHSIYFQVLGEHGIVGLILFLLLMLFAWRTGTRIVRACKDRDELKWASDLAVMCQVSIVGYAVGGAFLSLAYYDLYYDIIALLVLLEKFLLQTTKDEKNNAPSPLPQTLGGQGNAT